MAGIFHLQEVVTRAGGTLGDVTLAHLDEFLTGQPRQAVIAALEQSPSRLAHDPNASPGTLMRDASQTGGEYAASLTRVGIDNSGADGQGDYFGVSYASGLAYLASGFAPVLDKEHAFAPGSSWHIYRLEVRPRIVRFLIDGHVILSGPNTHDPRPGGIALGMTWLRLRVRSVDIIAL